MAAETKSNNDNEIDEMFKEYEKRILEFASILPDKRLPIPYQSKNTNIIGSNNILHDKFKPKRNEIYNSMKHCYPLIHGSVLSLAYDFIQIKKQYGSSKEQQLYKNMTMIQFFNRLATKRCVIFFQRYDEFSTQKGYNSNGNYESVGTDKEDARLSIKDCLSYDELLISSMCGISSATHFINNGNRANCGTVQQFDNRYPHYGYYIGLVGARFEKANVMEHALMAISNQQNTKEFGYGNYNISENNETSEKSTAESKNDIEHTEKGFNEQFTELLHKNVKNAEYNPVWLAFSKFYNRKYFPLFSEVSAEYNKNKSKYATNWSGNTFLDIALYKQRIRISLELFLFDADCRAKQSQPIEKSENSLSGAYCHIIGLGTGVWALNKQIQDTLIVEVVRDIVQQNDLLYIDMIYFSWMYGEALKHIMNKYENDFKIDKENNNYYMNDLHGHKISFEQGKRNPADVLDANYKKCLLVAMYAWDSNSFPGNEYYKGMLSASGDPAAASCSTISFVQNSIINKEYVNGANSMFYFTNINEKGRYQCYKLKDMQFEKESKKWLEMSRQSIPVQKDNDLKDALSETGQRLDDNKIQKKKDVELFLDVKAEKIICDKGQKIVKIQFVFIGNQRKTVQVNLKTTIKQLYAHSKFVSGYEKEFQLLTGFPPKPLMDPKATVEECKLGGARITQKAI